MGDYFSINNDVSKKINDPDYKGNLSQNDVDAFEKDETLFNKFITEGEKYKLAEQDESGNYKDINLAEFNNFIYNVAKEYGISLSNVSDDANLMFKFLDNDGNGILDNSELSALKDYDGRGSKSKEIDAYTIGHYFSKLDKKELESAKQNDDTINALKQYYETAKANGQENEAIDALKAAGFDAEVIKEITGAKNVANDLDSAINNPTIKNSIDGWLDSGKDADYIVTQLNGMYGTAGLYDSANDDLVREYVDNKINIAASSALSNDDIQAYADAFDKEKMDGKIDEDDCNAEYIKNKLKEDHPELKDNVLDVLTEQIIDAMPKG